MLLQDDDTTGREGNGPQRGMLDRDALPFLPKVRWRFWIPIMVFIAGMVAAYFISSHRRGRRLRAQLLAEHMVLTQSLAPPYREMRAKIERLAFSAIAPWQGTYTAPGFSLASLADEPVLYGRVRFGEIHRLEDVETSIRHRYPDQIASCTGIEAQLVYEAYRRGDFLMPAYVESVRGVSDGDRLAALRQDLQFRIERDTHDIIEWSRRRYFALAVDEAALSIDGPTRIYIWDLRDSRIVLRARGDAGSTMIIPVRIAGIPGGGGPVPRGGNALTLTEHDCSVANVVREQLGIQTLSAGSAAQMQPGTTPQDAATPQGATDAANPGAGSAPPTPQPAMVPSAVDGH